MPSLTMKSTIVVILPDITDINDTKSIAEKISISISQEDYVPNKNISLSASSGISVFPSDAKDGSSLLKLADDAMYIAKHSGKNRYHYTEQS